MIPVKICLFDNSEDIEEKTDKKSLLARGSFLQYLLNQSKIYKPYGEIDSETYTNGEVSYHIFLNLPVDNAGNLLKTIEKVANLQEKSQVILDYFSHTKDLNDPNLDVFFISMFDNVFCSSSFSQQNIYEATGRLCRIVPKSFSSGDLESLIEPSKNENISKESLGWLGIKDELFSILTTVRDSKNFLNWNLGFINTNTADKSFGSLSENISSVDNINSFQEETVFLNKQDILYFPKTSVFEQEILRYHKIYTCLFQGKLGVFEEFESEENLDDLNAPTFTLPLEADLIAHQVKGFGEFKKTYLGENNDSLDVEALIKKQQKKFSELYNKNKSPFFETAKLSLDKVLNESVDNEFKEAINLEL